MTSNVPIGNNNNSNITAPTPQNTPLTQAPISLGLSRPTVPDIAEDNEGDEEATTKSGLPANLIPGLNALVSGKLQDLVGKPSGYIDSLPTPVKLTIEGLKGVQSQHNELQEQFKRELYELEKKYLELSAPLFERRHALVTGTSKPTSEEIAAGEKVSLKDDEDYEDLPKDDIASAAPIPEFWLTALRNHIGLNEMITDRDAPALKHLQDVRLSYIDEPAKGDKPLQHGYKLAFVFSPNEYFENATLEKTYFYRSEIGYSGDFMYDRAIGTDIKWKEDKDLTKEFEIKKQRNKNTNRTRLVRKARPTNSFFNFFNPVSLPQGDSYDEIDEDEIETIEEKLEIDYQLGEDFKEKIVPHAIDWFTGKALDYEESFEDDEDLFGSDDDDIEEDEDSDSEDELPARRRGPPKHPNSNHNTKPDECKQQ